MRVSTAVEAKQEELGRQLTPGEVDFVRIQVERDEIVAQFRESRTARRRSRRG